VWAAAHPGAGYDGNFPWDRIAAQVRSTPRHLSLAIWGNERLCGLAAGTASCGADNVTIRFLERFHGDNPLQGLILPLAAEAAEAYAVVLGKRRVKIKNPTQGATSWYIRNGFVLDKRIAGAPYLAREVEDGGSTQG
jgi:hypothetical protein